MKFNSKARGLLKTRQQPFKVHNGTGVDDTSPIKILQHASNLIMICRFYQYPSEDISHKIKEKGRCRAPLTHTSLSNEKVTITVIYPTNKLFEHVTYFNL
jgi:hypothetical protein